MFSVHTSLEKFENRTFDLCLRKSWRHRFGKSSILKMVPSTLIKTQSRRSQIAQVWTVFSCEERPFWWEIIADGRPNRRIKTVFSNISGVVWTRSQCSCFSSITSQTKLFLRTDWLVVSTGMLTASYQESSFPLTNVRETSDPGEIRFEVLKYQTLNCA